MGWGGVFSIFLVYCVGVKFVIYFGFGWLCGFGVVFEI